jgi:hypothetical protein
MRYEVSELVAALPKHRCCSFDEGLTLAPFEGLAGRELRYVSRMPLEARCSRSA